MNFNRNTPASLLLRQTPSALPLADALANIEARQEAFIESIPKKPVPKEPSIADRETAPTIENTEDFARGFFKRLQTKEEMKVRPPRRGQKPRMIVDNTKKPKGTK